MDRTLYDLMDWAGIEEIVYSESGSPQRLLGPHLTDKGLLIQVYIPTAESILVRLPDTGNAYPMENADEPGYFAALLPEAEFVRYMLDVTYDNGTTQTICDPYEFPPQIEEQTLKKFDAGVLYDAYKTLGAHRMTIDGVEGTYFAVWAPCAMRVSVVGDFNFWDGRRHQMRKMGDHGVFELFIPGLKKGMIYKYEVKAPNGDAMLKADPYGSCMELRPGTASVIWDTDGFRWTDQEWMEKRSRESGSAGSRPMSIYEVHLGSWMRRPPRIGEDGKSVAGSEFCSYRELAVKLADYVKEMGYTHVGLMPVMEHPLDASWGYQITGYYAPTRRHGTPDDFQFFMNYMHDQGIGVILDWAPAQFPRDLAGLACFDGTCVYEHKDPRRGAHPQWGTLIFHYSRPQVANFLIANALYWAEVYHADGIRVDSAAAMLYLDYGKSPGQWIPNIYGGNENLEAAEFLKCLTSAVHKLEKGVLMIAEESAAWPRVTGDGEEALGFDFKWNTGWMNGYLDYMRCDPYFRSHRYGELTFSMLYAYSEDFILPLPHSEMSNGKGSMVRKMPGETPEQKLAHLRAAYGYWMTHPGKKLIFMGQDLAQEEEWKESEGLRQDLDRYEGNRRMKAYMKALNAVYRDYPAMYSLDHSPEGFEWIDCINSQENIAAFLRKTEKPEETLLIVCNFAPVPHEEYRIGVPFRGEYREILNSDALRFGGSGMVNEAAVFSEPEESDGREESAVIRIAPLSVQIFACIPGDRI